MDNKRIIIAIDGHSSCGKSTFAKAIAARLGYIFIDTGAMYRAVALYAIDNNLIDAENIDEIGLNNALDNIKIGVDMLHVGNTPFYSEVVEKMIPLMNADACMIVGGIHASEEKKNWWKQLKNDERVRITFDLYDIGIILFDPKRYKQNYIVNFF